VIITADMNINGIVFQWSVWMVSATIWWPEGCWQMASNRLNHNITNITQKTRDYWWQLLVLAAISSHHYHQALAFCSRLT